jgi:hypothetical protein
VRRGPDLSIRSATLERRGPPLGEEQSERANCRGCLRLQRHAETGAFEVRREDLHRERFAAGKPHVPREVRAQFVILADDAVDAVEMAGRQEVSVQTKVSEVYNAEPLDPPPRRKL